MSDTLFELSCNQTITPTVGTYTGADNNTPVYELVDSDYYLKNTSSHGYYYFDVTNIASRMKVSFDCVFNNKNSFNWIFLFENTQGQNWWGIGSYYSGLELRGTSTSAQTLKTNIADGTKLHIDIQIEHSTLANIVTILIDNNEVLNINLPATYELSNFELLGNTGNYIANCYIKDLSITTYGKNYLNKPGLAEVWANIKNYITAQLLGKSNTGHTHTKSEITDFPSFGTTAGTICEGNDSRLSDARTPTAHTHDASDIINLPSGSSQMSQIASRTIAPGQAAGSSGNAWSFTCTAGKLIYIKGTFKMSDTGGSISLTSGGDVVISAIGGSPGKVYNTTNLWAYTGEGKNVNVYLGSIIYPTGTTITITTYLLGGGSTASFYAYQ